MLLADNVITISLSFCHICIMIFHEFSMLFTLLYLLILSHLLSYSLFFSYSTFCPPSLPPFLLSSLPLTLLHSLPHSYIFHFFCCTIQTTEHRDFRERWQIERGILEGEGSSSVDLLEEFICSGDYSTSTRAIVYM